MKKDDLWCSYGGTQDFEEIEDSNHPEDSRYSSWQCTICKAQFEDNPGYGYFTSYWGDLNTPSTPFKFNPCTGGPAISEKVWR